jgi:hypothetical protein
MPVEAELADLSEGEEFRLLDRSGREGVVCGRRTSGGESWVYLVVDPTTRGAWPESGWRSGATRVLRLGTPYLSGA